MLDRCTSTKIVWLDWWNWWSGMCFRFHNQRNSASCCSRWTMAPSRFKWKTSWSHWYVTKQCVFCVVSRCGDIHLQKGFFKVLELSRLWQSFLSLQRYCSFEDCFAYRLVATESCYICRQPWHRFNTASLELSWQQSGNGLCLHSHTPRHPLYCMSPFWT